MTTLTTPLQTTEQLQELFSDVWPQGPLALSAINGPPHVATALPLALPHRLLAS